MLVSKTEAAKRQLDTAIRLMFGGDDPLAVHTLAGAVASLLDDILKKKEGVETWHKHVSDVTGLDPVQVGRVLRSAQNFLKHADRDHDAMLDFDPSFADEILILATLNIGELEALSREMQVFQAWYLARRANLLGSDFPFVREACELFPGVSQMGRAESLERAKEVFDICSLGLGQGRAVVWCRT